MSRRLGGRGVLRSLLGLVLSLAVLAIAYLAVAPVLHIGGVTAPPPRPPVPVFLRQWPDRKESVRFHHTSQGTRILPLSWFMALEQPVLTPLPVGRLAARDYLSRFGFIYETEEPLEVGYAAEQPATVRPASTAKQADA